jgi:hypothetical protein
LQNDFIPGFSGDEEKQKGDDGRLLGFQSSTGFILKLRGWETEISKEGK